MRQPKTHKRFEKDIIYGEVVVCGLQWCEVENASWRWKDVDCKTCLRLRGKKR